jgi:sec-independent protein translocase protein TatA
MAAEPNMVVGLFDLGSGAHWLIILFVGLLLFGRKLPEMMRGLGGSIREFKKGMDEAPPPPPPSSTQPPAPHIDGAVSRPSDPPAQPAAQAPALPPADAHPHGHSDQPGGHEPANPYARPDDPPQHH